MRWFQKISTLIFLSAFLVLSDIQRASSSNYGTGSNNEPIWWNQNPRNVQQGLGGDPWQQNYGHQVPQRKGQNNNLPRQQFDPNAAPRADWDTDDDFERGGPAPQQQKDLASERVEEFARTFPKKLLLLSTCGLLGLIMGLTISNSILHQPLICGVAGFVFTVSMGFWKGSMVGDLVRTAALALIWAVARSKRFRHGYPLLAQLRASFRLGPRRPFPPEAENPWQYEPQFPDDVVFSMTKAVVACGFLGLFSGWSMAKAINIFLVPTWLLSLAGLGCAVYLTTIRNAFGDLFRCLGMKIVAFLGLLKEVDGELRVSGKLIVLFKAILSHLLIFDKKFKITDKLFDALQRLFGQATQLASQMRESMDQRGAGVGAGRPPRRDPAQQRPGKRGDRPPTDAAPWDQDPSSTRSYAQDSRRGSQWNDNQQQDYDNNGQSFGYNDGSGYR